MIKFDIDLLTEDELALLLYIVNVHSPLDIPKMEFNKNTAKWFIHDKLVQRVVDAFPALKPEGHPIYSSLLNKMGVEHEIQYETPASGSAEVSGSIPLPPITGSNETNQVPPS